MELDDVINSLLENDNIIHVYCFKSVKSMVYEQSINLIYNDAKELI